MATTRSTDTARASVARPPTRRNAHLLRVLDPLRLRLLLEVDRFGSITRAAEACSMGQPTASTHLRMLEAAVGHRLYERAGRATRLTDAGRLLARHGRVVLSTLEGLDEELAMLNAGLTGTLLLSTCDTVGIYLLPAVLATFAQDRPHVEIRVRIAPSGEVVRAVAEGDAHVGIAGQTRRPVGVHAEPLLHDELVWIAPARRGRAQLALSAAGMRRSTVIVPAPESSTRAMTERILSSLGSHPAHTLEIESVEAVKHAVRAGLGVALVSRLAVAAELVRGELHELDLLGGAPPARLIEIVRKVHRKATPLERIFEHALRHHCLSIGAATGRMNML